MRASVAARARCAPGAPPSDWKAPTASATGNSAVSPTYDRHRLAGRLQPPPAHPQSSRRIERSAGSSRGRAAVAVARSLPYARGARSNVSVDRAEARAAFAATTVTTDTTITTEDTEDAARTGYACVGAGLVVASLPSVVPAVLPSTPYVRTLGGVYRVRSVGDLQMRFAATHWRNERTGFHARVDIGCNGTNLAYDTFNVDRDSERVRLANSAYAKLIGGRPNRERPELAQYPLVYLQDDLDQFCGGLREQYMDGYSPQPMHGATERRGPSFIAEPYILKDAGTIGFAPPGHGKSYLLYTLGVCVDAGLSQFWPVERTRVLVVNLERSQDSVAQRLGNINAALGLERDRPLDTINARGHTLEEVEPSIRRHIHRYGIGCVMLDSLSRAGAGNLIDNDVVNGYCNILNSFGVAWVAIGHSPRADESHLFGSQMFDAAADLMIKLTSQEKLAGPMGIALDLTKKNDVGSRPQWIGAFEFDRAGLVNIREARPGEFSELETGQHLSNEDRIAAHLARLGALTATQVSLDLNIDRSRISDMFNNNDLFVLVRREGKNALYGVRERNTSGHATRAQHDQPWWNQA